MGFGSYAGRAVATKIVATDGTGDFTSIQDAIDDLPATGGVVYIKEGTYEIDTDITIDNNNIALIGAGNSTVITDVLGSGMYRMITITSSDYCRIENIKFLATADQPDGVYFNNCSYNVITGCVFDNVDSALLFANSSYHNIITENIISNTVNVDVSIETGCHYNIISNNTTNDGGNLSIYLYASNYCSIIGNTCENSGEQAIIVAGNSVGVIVSGNTCISGGSSGIHIYGHRNVIVGNVCNENVRGIWIYSGTKNIVVSNVFVNNTTEQLDDDGTTTEIAHNITT